LHYHVVHLLDLTLL